MDQHPFPRAVFKPTISAGEQPQTYAFNRAATGTGVLGVCKQNYSFACFVWA